jgi:hypothetical protein
MLQPLPDDVRTIRFTWFVILAMVGVFCCWSYWAYTF